MRMGLTGGIACGKSTAARCFEALGAAVIDADRLSRSLVEPGSEALGLIAEHFGSQILTEGALNRRMLGGIVFKNDAERRWLNDLLHPRIHREALRLADEAESRGQVAVYEAALLFEVGAERDFHPVVAVVTSREMQIKRLMDRDRCDEAAALLRLKAQMPAEEKAHLADYVIENDGDLVLLRAQVEAIWKKVVGERGERGNQWMDGGNQVK